MRRSASPPLSFPPFRLEGDGGGLWRGSEPVPLRPKSLAVLRTLAARAGELVPKAELLATVWPDVAVSEVAVKVCIRDLRRALGDAVGAPRYIQTVGRRGYRFAARLQAAPRPGAPSLAAPPVFVGRDTELERLFAACAPALRGERQVVFVAGEAGAGKTTLLAAFAQRLPPAERWRVARGQCVESYGAGEPYLPFFEALTRLCSGRDGAALVATLRAHAPSWLAHLPALVSPAELRSLRRRSATGGQERLLRELLDGLEALSRRRPLLLLLEDLHWSDRSTLALLAALARRVEPARLLVVATHRPADAGGDDALRPLLGELLLHRQVTAIALAPLTRASIDAYLAERFGGARLPDALGALMARCSDGNPLFLTLLADDLVARGLIAADGAGWRLHAAAAELERELPRTLVAAVRDRLQLLTAEERRTLEAASVAGATFAPAAVAWALATEADEAAARCARLARAGAFLRTLGEAEMPQGDAAPLYGFAHEFHRATLCDAIPPVRRTAAHRRIADGLEAAWGERAAEVAGELALHCERGGDLGRAVRYRQLACERAVQRHAYREAIEHGTRGLALLARQPPSRQRDRQELALRMRLGVPQLGTQGFAAPEVRQTYARALRLSQRVGQGPELFQALEGLHSFYAVAGALPTAHRLAQRMARIAAARGERGLRLEAHHALGNAELRRGRLRAARVHLARAVALYGRQPRPDAYTASGHDPGVCCLSVLAVVEWLLGRPEPALRLARRGVALAEAVAQPFSLALAGVQLAWVHLLRGEAAAAQAAVDAALAIAAGEGFVYFTAAGMMFDAWARAQAGEATAAQAALGSSGALFTAIGARGELAGYYAVAGEVCALGGKPAQTAAHAADGLRLVRHSGVRYVEPELYRQRGAAALAAGDRRAAGRHLRRALQVARRQGSAGYALRTALSLAPLLPAPAAARTLTAALRAIRDGAQTRDVRAAAALLAELRRRRATR